MSTDDDAWASGRPPPPPPPPPYSYAAPQTEGKAVAALVCAIASFMVLPFFPAVVAVVLASSSRKEIAASGGRLTGESMATAALVIGWINIALCALGAVVLFVVLFLWARDTSARGLAAVLVLGG